MCRVDFRESPTVTSTMVLEVVKQASKPVVITDSGVEVMGSVGPYMLGTALILVCMAEGEPPPRVVWLRDGVLWDEQVWVCGRGHIMLSYHPDGPWRRGGQAEEEHAGDISAREDPCREHAEVRGREQQCEPRPLHRHSAGDEHAGDGHQVIQGGAGHYHAHPPIFQADQPSLPAGGRV